MRSIRKTERAILVEIDRNSYWIIPRRAFASPPEADQFYTRAVALWTTAVTAAV